MARFTFAVYDPPNAGLPYLAIVIAPGGEIAAVPYKTAAEAEDHTGEQWRLGNHLTNSTVIRKVKKRFLRAC
jgi:hypothetical protein